MTTFNWRTSPHGLNCYAQGRTPEAGPIRIGSVLRLLSNSAGAAEPSESVRYTAICQGATIDVFADEQEAKAATEAAYVRMQGQRGESELTKLYKRMQKLLKSIDVDEARLEAGLSAVRKFVEAAAMSERYDALDAMLREASILELDVKVLAEMCLITSRSRRFLTHWQLFTNLVHCKAQFVGAEYVLPHLIVTSDK